MDAYALPMAEEDLAPRMKDSMMNQQILKTEDFWLEIECNVAAKVDTAINSRKFPREALILYLRDLETMARAQCGRRQTVQIIASGRSVLGDRTVLGPQDGPFSHA